jgi:beta-N-acetylhexosaminidase
LPASLSPTVIADIIRGRIGFDGWLMSDDLGMEALAGDMGSRAAGVVAAGCDVALHCSGKLDEMIAVAKAVPPMTAQGEARLSRAMAGTRVDTDDGADFAEALANRDALLALA